MPHTFDSKADARAWGLQLRCAIPKAERDTISARIAAHLIALPQFMDADTLLTYVGSKDGELDTCPIITLALHARKMVLVPITRPRGVMEWSRLLRLEDLAPSSRGILEPREHALDPLVPTNGLCIVPGVCFRRDGHRIGFGAGYYDRFLRDFAGTAIALCAERLAGAYFPVEAHDQPVSAIVTETGVHEAVPLTCG